MNLHPLWSKAQLIFVPREHFFYPLFSFPSPAGSNATVVEITVVVVVLLCLGIVAGVVLARKRNLLGGKSSSNGRISFENPSYIREQNGDTVQVRKRGH